MVELIGSLLTVPDPSNSRAKTQKKLETVSVNQGLKAAVKLGLAFHTSCEPHRPLNMLPIDQRSFGNHDFLSDHCYDVQQPLDPL